MLTTLFGASQIIGGLALNSVALLADSAHNISDGAAVAAALGAATLASRRATGRRTYGWGRIEILAALLNGLLLVVLGVVIAIEAVRRVGDPRDVAGVGVIAFGVLGLALNGIAVVLMLRARAARHDINLRGALLHTAGDAVGSLGVVIAGTLVAAFGWAAADPIVALVVSALIVGSAWTLVAQPISILLERAPAGVDPAAVAHAICGVPGVVEAHDLHVWTITSGFDALSVHVVVTATSDPHTMLHTIEQEIHRKFGITHTTIQVDKDHRAPLSIHRKGCPEAPKARTSPLEFQHDH